MDTKLIDGMKNILNISTWEKDTLDFEDCHIHYIREGHILQVLANEDKWTLPCLLVSSHLKCDEPSTPPVSPSNSKVNESFEGSPLKLQEFSTENFITAPTTTTRSGPVSVFRPISVNKARLVLSLYCLASDDLLQTYILREEPESLPPLWVLCDAKDKERTVILGVHATQHKHQKHITTTNVCVQGPLLPDSKSVCQLWSKRPGFSQVGKSGATKCFARYCIQGCLSNNDTLAATRQQGALEVHFVWSRLNALLQAPPVEAKANVKATVVTGDPRSAAHLLYTELTVLKSLVESLDTGLAHWASITENVPLLIRVKQLVKGTQGIVTIDETQEDKHHDSSVFLNAANNVFIEQREELDFTEQLWNILKDCTSFKDLVQCFLYIFDCLGKGDLQPVVHRDNKSTLAQLIRDSYYNQMATPDLDGAIPLELLVEIGLEKLQNDYTNAFLSKELVTCDSLEKFTQRQGSPSERVLNLDKLHHALELIAMLETLSLPKITLSISARNALKCYETGSPDSNHTFTIPVQTSDVRTITERFQPSDWQAELSDHQSQSYCMYQFSERPPFDHVFAAAGPDETMADHKQSYYLTILNEDTIML